MTTTAISVIVAVLALLLFGWWKSKNAEVTALTDKTDALEQAAEQERAEEEAEDAAEAEEVVRSGDTKRVIGFLRDSFVKAGNKVSTP